MVVVKWGCTQPSYLSPYEIICAIQTKTGLDYIKDIIDSIAYDDKRNTDDDLFDKSIVSLPSKKERYCTVCFDKCNPVTSCKRSKTEFTEYNKGVHAKCSLKPKCIYYVYSLGYHYVYLAYYFYLTFHNFDLIMYIVLYSSVIMDFWGVEDQSSEKLIK